MKTFATLALLALANAINIQSHDDGAQSHDDGSQSHDDGAADTAESIHAPLRSDLPDADECNWLLNGQDKSTATEEILSREADWEEGKWYCEHAASCWDNQPDGDHPNDETLECLLAAFESQDQYTADDVDAAIVHE